MPKIPKELATQVRQRANYRCEYCKTSEWLSGQRHEIDHIIPRARDGKTNLDNLCLACATCNGFKSDRIEGIDIETAQPAPLFNPRTLLWQDHFAWSDDGTVMRGLTACGRVTVSLLQTNQPLVVAARTIWVSIDRHPPTN